MLPFTLYDEALLTVCFTPNCRCRTKPSDAGSRPARSCTGHLSCEAQHQKNLFLAMQPGSGQRCFHSIGMPSWPLISPLLTASLHSSILANPERTVTYCCLGLLGDSMTIRRAGNVHSEDTPSFTRGIYVLSSCGACRI